MKLLRLLAGVALLSGVAALAYVVQRGEPAGARMVAAAQKFLDSLTPEQRTIARFDYDSKERTNWHFVPLQDEKQQPTRKGLSLSKMTPAQKKLALDLLASSTSAVGSEQAQTIMGFEAILREQESKGGKPGKLVRDPEWYFFTIFGTPGKTGKWGWRVEGHHLSLNFTMDGTEVVTATPMFFGSNPAIVVSGKDKGKRPLAAEELLAYELVKALDADQKKIAIRDTKFPEVSARNVKPTVGEPVGLPASKMTEAQKAILTKLMHAYTDAMAPSAAAREWKLVKDAGFDKIHFAFQGGLEKGQAHTYRVQGPTFVIEFINEQKDSAGNPANHIHSVWRRITGDFGL